MAKRRPHVDEKDLAIIRVLLRDGRATHSMLAQTTKLSPTACKARIRKLEASGVIEKYTIKLGTKRKIPLYKKYVLIELDSNADNVRRQVEGYCAGRPEVETIELIEGNYDYLVLMNEFMPDDHRTIISDVGKIDGVRRTTTLSIIEKIDIQQNRDAVALAEHLDE